MHALQVGIKYGGFITCTRVVTDEAGDVVELEATFAPEAKAAVKGYLHWVSPSTPGAQPHKATVRMYGPLFNEALEMVEGSLQTIENALIDDSLIDAPALSRFQFERVSLL